MLCDICGKVEATVHLTEIVNDKMTKLHLCENCAREKGAEMEEHFGLNDLMSGLADLGSNLEPAAMNAIKCPSCGFTYQDFKKVGRLGCGNCYEAFKKQLDPLLKRIHGANRHIGKVPLMSGEIASEHIELQDLKAKLEKAISAEEFEDAAKIRDKIRAINEKMKLNGGK
ncbi:MAG: UvrB/UvrC motif-containing protein [Candidatus Omnitrophica bacterium]|nr:UvrB/UvrC motif-containing protein [Candidatus Omnitrophota bacterium]